MLTYSQGHTHYQFIHFAITATCGFWLENSTVYLWNHLAQVFFFRPISEKKIKLINWRFFLDLYGSFSLLFLLTNIWVFSHVECTSFIILQNSYNNMLHSPLLFLSLSFSSFLSNDDYSCLSVRLQSVFLLFSAMKIDKHFIFIRSCLLYSLLPLHNLATLVAYLYPRVYVHLST